VRPLSQLDAWRILDDRVVERYGGNGCDNSGFFRVLVGMLYLRVIATTGDGWDHVSVSTPVNRCPTWDEMEIIKRMFFRPTEVAMQLHVTPENHVNCHPFTLHLWRPLRQRIPMPPKEFV
jgi:hypothetical protein